MTHFDDKDLETRGQHHEEPELDAHAWQPETRDRSADGPKRLLVLLLVGAVVAGVLCAWWWWRSFKQASVVDNQITREQPTQREPASARGSEDSPPPSDPIQLFGSDEVIRQVASRLSSHPRLAAWLANDDLVERFVKSTANVAYGEDPRVHVKFMRPGREFEATEAGGVTVISERSYDRFTPMVEVLASLDPAGTTELYRRLQPALEEAFEQLGYPGTFRETLDRAVERTLAIEVPRGPIEVTQEVISYRYADPELQQRPEFDKLMIRMGPNNVRRLQDSVRRLAAALPRA